MTVPQLNLKLLLPPPPGRILQQVVLLIYNFLLLLVVAGNVSLVMKHHPLSVLAFNAIRHNLQLEER